MRPPTLWEGVEDDPRSLAKRDKTTGMTPAPTPSSHNDRPASRIDSGGGFKRTLSAVVEQDAQRIASLRYRPSAPKSSLNQSHKAIPMTSPPRASTSASRSMRNVRWNGNAHAGASSPGGWAEPMHPGVPQSDNFNPVNESPNTAIRRILGTEIPMQSLEMPLSDDGTMSRPTDAATFNWDTDLSAFFDVEGFSLDSDPAQGRSPPAEPTKFHRALSSAARRRREETATEDEDALSQLLNRASSIGLESSPIPFDFSQLPPSSPPVMPNDLPHSALLLSSPDNSPMGYSPLDRELTYRISPEKRSGLHQSFMPNDEKSNLDYADPHHQGNYDAFHELLGRMQDADGSMMSSAGMAEGLVGGDDLLALLNSSFNAE